MNFMGKTTFVWSNFFIVRFAYTKNCSLYFLCFLLCFCLKYLEIQGKVFVACKANDKEIWPIKCGFASEIQVSWLSYGDIKIWDTFLYEYTPTSQSISSFGWLGWDWQINQSINQSAVLVDLDEIGKAELRQPSFEASQSRGWRPTRALGEDPPHLDLCRTTTRLNTRHHSTVSYVVCVNNLDGSLTWWKGHVHFSRVAWFRMSRARFVLWCSVSTKMFIDLDRSVSSYAVDAVRAIVGSHWCWRMPQIIPPSKVLLNVEVWLGRDGSCNCQQ